jgi:hypothetical protein
VKHLKRFIASSVFLATCFQGIFFLYINDMAFGVTKERRYSFRIENALALLFDAGGQLGEES